MYSIVNCAVLLFYEKFGKNDEIAMAKLSMIQVLISFVKNKILLKFVTGPYFDNIESTWLNEGMITSWREAG